VVDEGLRSGLEAVEPTTPRGNPQSICVGEDAAHILVRQAIGVGQVDLKPVEGVAVMAVEALLGAEPHIAGGILCDRVDHVVREAVLHGHVAELYPLPGLSGLGRRSRKAGKRHEDHTEKTGVVCAVDHY